jgi:hypothetical protein
MRARVSLAFAACALVAAFVSACSDDPGQPGGNRAPETGLVFIGDLDTTLYVQEVKWWGSDTDGDVVGFEYRWVPRGSAPDFDTSWVFTTDVRDTFALPTPEGFSEYDFYVRAIDDRDERDATPATQRHPFRNAAPSCSLSNTGSLPDTLFPSFELAWVAGDPDGEGTLSHFLVWVDGAQANPIVVDDGAARSIGLAPADFPSEGQHTIYVQAVDSGLRGCEPDSFSAYILPSAGDVLLVDDMSRNDPRGGTAPFESGYARFADFFYATNLDTFYRQERQEPFATIELELFPITSREQAKRLLDSYQTIVWYDQVGDSMSSPSLAAAAELLPDWIRGGGKLALITTYAVGQNVLNYNPSAARGDTIPEALFADFDPRFRSVVAGIDSILLVQASLPSTYAFEGNTVDGVVLEDLKLPGGFLAPVSMDILEVQPDADRLYTIPAGTAVSEAETLTTEGTVGLRHAYGEGRFVLLGVPYSRLRDLVIGEAPHAEFRKVLLLTEDGS